jgi:LmbE family N-acetylglucosaminyl deacetylase
MSDLFIHHSSLFCRGYTNHRAIGGVFNDKGANAMRDPHLVRTGESAAEVDSSANRDPHGAGRGNIPRRDFISASAFAAAAAGAAILPTGAAAAQAKSDADGASRKKTFLAVEGHMDDAEIGAGGVLIQAAKAGHRVVIVTITGDYTSWAPTVGREERTKRELVELAQSFGFEKRFLDGKYHQTNGNELELKRKLAEINVELKPDVAFISHYEDHWPDHSGSGIAAKDAFLFSHGLTRDLTAHRASLIYAYGVTPHQTYHFEPDVYYDVTDVMPAYMDLIARVEAVRTGRSVQQEIRHEFRTLAGEGQTLPLSAHGVLRLAEALRWGDQSGCRFAVGFRTVWGQRRGPKLF